MIWRRRVVTMATVKTIGGDGGGGGGNGDVDVDREDINTIN